MNCKQCQEPFPKAGGHDMWQFRRQRVEPTNEGESSNVHIEDAGVFCSRECLRGYLSGSDQSGIFNLRKAT
jgi:hypothetical protein